MKDRGKSRSRGRSETGTESAGKGGSSWLPSWGPYVAFGLLTLFLFREFIISNGMLFGTDVVALGYFARHFYVEAVRSLNTFPQWNPYIFGGLPFVDAMHGDIFYPTTVLKFVMPVHRGMGWKLVLHVFLAGVFTYGWLRHLKISRPIATWGGVAYMLAPVMVSLVYPGHDGKLFVTALTPLALWVTDRAITRGGARRFATLALVVALLVFTAHMQLAYYATWAVLALAVFRLVQARREGQPAVSLARRFAVFALAGLVGGLAIGAVQLWTPLRYLTTYSQRVGKTIEAEAETAYARATSWSLHPEEAFSLVVPEFIGANLQTAEGLVQTYWGRNPFKLNHEYGGLIPLLLVPLAFITRRRRGEVWLFTGIGVVSLVYALGATTPLFRLFYWLVPGVKLFRAPSSIMFLFAIAVITAAALGLEGVRQREGDKDWGDISRKVTLYLWAGTGVFLLLAMLGAAGALTDLWVSTLYRDIAPAKAAALQANLPNIRRGLWLAFVLAGLLAGAWHLRSRKTLPNAGWITAIILLSVFDLLRISPQFLRVVNPALVYPRDDTTDFLLQQQRGAEPFRVFSVSQGATYQTNHFAFYGLEELTGHHGNEMGRYLELIDFQRAGAQAFRVLRLLNVRYLVTDRPVQTPELREVFRGSRSIVYELPGAFPRAFLVSDFETAPDSVALDRLLSPGFDPKSRAIVEREPGFERGSGAGGRVRWLERGINRQALEVETAGPALLVISENYYPSWRARLDGEPVPLLRADYTLRAVEVPAGRHRVSLEYRSPLFRAAVWTSLLSTLFVAGLIVASLYAERRRGSSAAEETSPET
jgi:hypothetical protein